MLTLWGKKVMPKIREIIVGARTMALRFFVYGRWCWLCLRLRLRFRSGRGSAERDEIGFGTPLNDSGSMKLPKSAST
jgi:hypothetical protein